MIVMLRRIMMVMLRRKMMVMIVVIVMFHRAYQIPLSPLILQFHLLSIY
jgi:hypothetical protein